jgi:hypothetical protein
MAPLVSLALPVKNALPHLRSAIDGIRRQEYRDYELIIQDGGSTDGTLEYLKSISLAGRIDLESAPDTGIGQAYNRALQRCAGDFICLVSSDECLEDGALQRAVHWFDRHPDAVVINGSVQLTDADEVMQVFDTPNFDLLRHLQCEVVLPFSGLLNRKKIGHDLRYDETLRTCPDYDFWIRLGVRFDAKDFVAVKEPFKSARADRSSMSFRPESFEQFSKDKLFSLYRFLDAQPPSPVVEAVRRSAGAGIHAWAAESLFDLEGASSLFMAQCREAARFDPWSPRLHRLATMSSAFTIEVQSGRFVAGAIPQPNKPRTATIDTSNTLDVRRTNALSIWIDAGAAIEQGPAMVVRTPRVPWSYAAQIPLVISEPLEATSWYWAKLDMEVLSGRIGVGLLVDRDILHEQTATAANGRTTVYVKISRCDADGIVIRNSGFGGAGEVRLWAASVERSPKPDDSEWDRHDRS